MAAAASRMTLKVPTRLMRRVRSKSSRGWGPLLPSTFSAVPMPAAFTAPCTPPKASLGQGQRGLYVGLAGHVGAGKAGARAQLSRERFAGRRIHVEDDYVRSRGVQPTDRRTTQAGGATGDQERLLREFHVG